MTLSDLSLIRPYVDVRGFRTVIMDTNAVLDLYSTPISVTPSWNQYLDGASGNALKEFAVRLALAEEQHRKFWALINRAFTQPPQETVYRTIAAPVFSSAEILATIDAAQTNFLYLDAFSLIETLFDAVDIATIIRGLRMSIKELKRVLSNRQRHAIFCGMEWCKRAWFLLHGSHPPKLEGAVNFESSWGCAQA